MGRVVGYRGKNILFVSDSDCVSKSVSCAPVPPELAGASSDDLMKNYVVWQGRLVGASEQRSPKDIKVAFVSNFNVACGIATYSKWLYQSIGPMVKEHMIFAERPTEPVPQDPPNVVRCWNRGESMSEMVQRIHEYAPDVVLIQHEYGLFPNARYWMSLMSQLSRYRTIVTLHSVYKSHYDKIVCEMAIPEIVVHTNAARSVLASHEVVAPVTVIPHGCPLPTPEPKVWNMYRSEHTFIQFGFGFRYKGWEASIEIAARLKEKYPDVFFTGLFSESPYSKHLHNAYYAELEELIAKLGVQDNVALIRGFSPESMLMYSLRMNRAAVFPYIDNGEHTVYGCSGAARLAMKACIPVIASKAPLFDDLDGVLPRPETIDDICAELSALFDNQKRREEQVAKQCSFLVSTSWEKAGEAYVNLFSMPRK